MQKETQPIVDRLAILGWREWIGFPTLNAAKLIAKVDTGAKSSALHVESFEKYRHPSGQVYVRFVLPQSMYDQDNDRLLAERTFDVPLKDQRIIKNSGGQKQQRCVIELPIAIGSFCFEIEVSLTCRKAMKYPMLLGRTAITKRFLVDVDRSFQLGQPM